MSSVISSRFVKVKKDRVCFGCGRIFPAGTKMKCDAVVDDSLWSCYLCATCEGIASEMDWWDEFGHGDLRDDALKREAARRYLRPIIRRIP